MLQPFESLAAVRLYAEALERKQGDLGAFSALVWMTAGTLCHYLHAHRRGVTKARERWTPVYQLLCIRKRWMQRWRKFGTKVLLKPPGPGCTFEA